MSDGMIKTVEGDSSGLYLICNRKRRKRSKFTYILFISLVKINKIFHFKIESILFNIVCFYVLINMMGSMKSKTFVLVNIQYQKKSFIFIIIMSWDRKHKLSFNDFPTTTCNNNIKKRRNFIAIYQY